MKENDKKLKEYLQIYNNIFRRNESANVNSLLKLRSILINQLKDSDQYLVYSKFMTEKKIKYLLKNKEKMKSRIKILDNELNSISNRKNELEQILSDLYINYDEED